MYYYTQVLPEIISVGGILGTSDDPDYSIQERC